MAYDHHHGVAPGLAAPERADHPGAAPLTARDAPPAGLNPTPTSDNAPWQARVGEQGSSESHDFNASDEVGGSLSEAAPLSAHALKVIEGNTKAEQYLARLHAQQADPDELAVIVSMLYGAALRGFCNAIVKALGGRYA